MDFRCCQTMEIGKVYFSEPISASASNGFMYPFGYIRPLRDKNFEKVISFCPAKFDILWFFLHLYLQMKSHVACLSMFCSPKLKYFQNVLRFCSIVQQQLNFFRKFLEIQKHSKEFLNIFQCSKLGHHEIFSNSLQYS